MTTDPVSTPAPTQVPTQVPTQAPTLAPTLAQLRRYAVARSLFAPCSLAQAVARLAFVQADPLRAPARAQDLILWQRVRGYRVGDLEAQYPLLDVEEDFFINYGFLPRALQQLMHPRTPRKVWPDSRQQQASEVLAFVQSCEQAHGPVRPAQVDAHFDMGRVTNWFGGQSRASTELLDGMHYRGTLRVARREGGQRLYALPVRGTPPHPALARGAEAALDALVDAVVALYAPLPTASLSQLVGMLGAGVPQWRSALPAALKRAKQRLGSAVVGDVVWHWPADEHPASRPYRPQDRVRLLAPFDPVVWDRRRFELLWGWAYRFEAYTPAAKRVRGHYAMPLLWQDRVIGWANVSTKNGALAADVGYVAGAPTHEAFAGALDDELHRMAVFLGLAS